MDFEEYIRRYSDVNQIARGIYVMGEISGDRKIALAKYLLEKTQQENMLSFYKEIASMAMSSSGFSHLRIMPEEEMLQ